MANTQKTDGVSRTEKIAQLPQLTDSIATVRGFGPKRVAAMHKAGIFTLQDVLLTYPARYEDRSVITPIDDCIDGISFCIRATVGTQATTQRMRNGSQVSRLRVFDDSATLDISFFHNRYAAQALQLGHTYLFYGQVREYGRQLIMTNPTFELAPLDGTGGKIVPIYPLSGDVKQGDMLRLSEAALGCTVGTLPDVLPDALREKYGFPALSDAIFTIHRPQKMEDLSSARKRMLFEDIFVLCCGLQQLRNTRHAQAGFPFYDGDLHAFCDQLGFAPTAAQDRVMGELLHDLRSGLLMNRMVQGDVGSGKTVIAALACYLAVANNFQAAFMAPTEILANQHLLSLTPIFTALGMRADVLLGSHGAKRKREVKQAMADGTLDVVIGTHALVQDDVAFANLGLVVTDEQHRFGVGQRNALVRKGTQPHTLVMSATPIPRTLALMLYGDLDVSVIDQLPPNRKPIETYVVGEKMRKRIYTFAEKQILEGGQVYVVCPLVEQGESQLVSAQEHAQNLQQALPHRRVGLLHGRMKGAEKDAIMTAFSQGALDILVSTTVIEVGVNVPNANLMIVEDGQQFGLSQLHQLRGRVGRGTRQSYCICFGADKGEAAKKRLDTLASTTDGFKIAKADLTLRGPGDFLGSRQSGLPAIHLGDYAQDLQLMQQAQEEAAALLAIDATLESHPILASRIARLLANDGSAPVLLN